MCISKGKEHKKYEFGNKVSILYTQTTGVIVGAMSFRNPYDGHTLESALEQRHRLLDSKVETIIADRGYKGKSQIGDTLIHIPKPFKKSFSTTSSHRTHHWTFKDRSPIRTQLLQRS